MRTSVQRLGQRVLWLTGMSALARRVLVADGRFVVELHGVAKKVFTELPHELRPSMTAESLRRLLSWLTRRFRFLSPDELLYSAKPGVLITFDDGFANHLEVALPVLEEFEAPAVLFVPSRHVDDPEGWLPSELERLARHGLKAGDLPGEVRHGVLDGLSKAQLRQCAEHPLVTVGSHTVDHPRLAALSEDEMKWQLEGSKARLEELSGTSVDLLAYPFGDYDARVANAAETAGYSAAFAEISRCVGDPRFEMPRIGVYSSSSAYLAAKLSGMFDRPLKGAIAT